MSLEIGWLVLIAFAMVITSRAQGADEKAIGADTSQNDKPIEEISSEQEKYSPKRFDPTTLYIRFGKKYDPANFHVGFGKRLVDTIETEKKYDPKNFPLGLGKKFDPTNVHIGFGKRFDPSRFKVGFGK